MFGANGGYNMIEYFLDSERRLGNILNSVLIHFSGV